jgi:hypothetical protein
MLGMAMEVFLAWIKTRMDLWNATCSEAEIMTLENHGEVWELDHEDHLAGAANIAEKLARCVGELQQPLIGRLHLQKSIGEMRLKTPEMIATEQTNLLLRADEARAHVHTSRSIFGDNSPNTMDCLKRLGDILVGAKLHGEALEVELFLRNIRVHELGWDDPATLQSCTRYGCCLAQLGRHADAMAVLGPAFDAHCRLYSREHRHTLTVVVLMVKSLSALGERNRVEQLLLRKTDAEMAHRLRAMQAPEVRCRRGLVSVLAN